MLVSLAGPVGAAAAGEARAAACGSARHYTPSAPASGARPPLAIGDSTMLGAAEELRRRGFEVDVRGCRQMSEGLAVLATRARADTLPDTVMIGLGTNWTVDLAQIRLALRIVGRERVLGLVTPREAGGVASSDQAAMRAAGRRWPARVRTIDWVAHSAGHADWFGSDGLHLTFKGARALARLMKTAVSNGAPAPNPAPQPAPPPTGPGAETGGGAPAP